MKRFPTKLFTLILFLYQKDEKYPLEGARKPGELQHRPQSYTGHLEPKRFYTLKVTLTFPELCLNLLRALVPPSSSSPSSSGQNWWAFYFLRPHWHLVAVHSHQDRAKLNDSQDNLKVPYPANFSFTSTNATPFCQWTPHLTSWVSITDSCQA